MKIVNDNRCWQLLCISVFGKIKLGIEYAYQVEFVSFRFKFVRRWLLEVVKQGKTMVSWCETAALVLGKRLTNTAILSWVIMTLVLGFAFESQRAVPKLSHKKEPSERTFVSVISTIVDYLICILEISGIHIVQY
jgi:hypothetical protein